MRVCGGGGIRIACNFWHEHETCFVKKKMADRRESPLVPPLTAMLETEKIRLEHR